MTQNSGTAPVTLYKILRGQLSLRNGDMEPAIDPETQKPVKGLKRRRMVHYRAGGVDEVYLTIKQAMAFGLHRLKVIQRRDYQTSQEPEPVKSDAGAQAPETDDPRSIDRATQQDEAPSREDAEPASGNPFLDELIKAGHEARGAVAFNQWRTEVLASALLVEVPRNRSEILRALEALKVEIG